MIHNRYLPDCLHRLMNALVLGTIWCCAGVAIWSTAPSASVWFAVGRAIVFATPVILVSGLFVRRSFVRGVAGGEGYDELS